MKMKLFLAASMAICVTNAAEILIYGSPWLSPAGENSGGGSSQITSTAPRSGNSSVEMTGDRTRWILGNMYTAGPQTDLGLLSSVTNFGFDWMVAPGSTSNLGPNYTPALRLHIIDGAQRSELIWEGAYNGVTVTQGTWNSVDATTANLWRWVTGSGVTLKSGSQVTQTLSQWAANNNAPYDDGYVYSANARVAAISVGIGSSVGAGYHAFADNVDFGSNLVADSTFNFEQQAVPEPSTWTLMAAGVGLISLKLRRRQ